jgi:hypothetical protein
VGPECQGDKGAARVWLGQRPTCWAWPTRERGAGGKEKKTGRVQGRPRRAELGRKPKEADFPFLFPFPIFQSIFQKILKSILNLIQTTQYKIFKCSSMNAQSYFYSYI